MHHPDCGNSHRAGAKDDTLKNILTVPLTFRRLLVAKLLVCGLLSLFLGLVCTAFTVLAGLLTGFPGFSAGEVVHGLVQITVLNLFLYISVMPIILLTSRSPGGFLARVIVAFAYGYGGMFAAGNLSQYSMKNARAGRAETNQGTLLSF